MQKKPIKLTLTVCTALALFSVSGVALADDQVTNTSPIENTTLPTNTDEKAADIERVITVVNPATGEKTVVNQSPNSVATSTGETIKLWPEYFAPEISGYRPSKIEVPAKLITPRTKPSKVTITYHPVTADDLQTAHVNFAFDDVSKQETFPLSQLLSDENGYVKIPEAPEGWEFVNSKLIPKQIRTYLNGPTPFFHLLVQMKGDKPTAPIAPAEPETKQVTRKIILHLPDGDKVISQTATATKKDKLWKIGSFASYQVPTVEGYSASIKEVPEKTLTIAEFDQPQVVEVSYQLDEVRDDSEEKTPEPGKSEETPTDQPSTGNEQDENIDRPEEGTGSTEEGDQDKVTDDQEEVAKPDSGEKGDNNQSEKDEDQNASEKDEENSIEDSKEVTDQTKPGENNDKQPEINEQDKVIGDKDDSAGVSGNDQTTSDLPITETPDQDKPATSPSINDQPTERPNTGDNDDQQVEINKGDTNLSQGDQEETPVVPDNSNLTTKDEEQIGQPQENHSGQLVDTVFTPVTKTGEMNDPLLGQKLEQLQAPLNHLEDEYNLSNQSTLPQTGNKSAPITTLVALVITAWTALTSMLLINKKLINCENYLHLSYSHSILITY